MRPYKDAARFEQTGEWQHHVAALKPILNQTIRLTQEDVVALKAAAVAGDKGARDSLINACVAYACKLAREYHERTGLDLDECISSALLACVQRVDDFDPSRGTLLTFVHCVMRSALPEAGRQAGRGVRAATTVINFDTFADRRVNHEARARIVHAAIDSLQGRSKTIAELHYLDGLSFAEIGRRLGVTRERIRQLNVRVSARIKEEIRKHLDDV